MNDLSYGMKIGTSFFHFVTIYLNTL